tara:strand:- start:419 stop:682 length:264 start_codon:yes stop_codon:yes gene_type:complete
MAVKIEDFSGNVLFTVSDADYATAKANQFEDGKIKLVSGSSPAIDKFYHCYEYTEANKDTLAAELTADHAAEEVGVHFVVARPDGIE